MIELHHKRLGHIIQPFTSLGITHLNPLPPPLWSCSYETQLDLFAMRAEWSGADRDMIISLLMAAGKRKDVDNWITQQSLSHRNSAARQAWTQLKDLKGCFDPHPSTSMISRSHNASLLTQIRCGMERNDTCMFYKQKKTYFQKTTVSTELEPNSQTLTSLISWEWFLWLTS